MLICEVNTTSLRFKNKKNGNTRVSFPKSVQSASEFPLGLRLLLPPIIPLAPTSPWSSSFERFRGAQVVWARQQLHLIASLCLALAHVPATFDTFFSPYRYYHISVPGTWTTATPQLESLNCGSRSNQSWPFRWLKAVIISITTHTSLALVCVCENFYWRSEWKGATISISLTHIISDVASLCRSVVFSMQDIVCFTEKLMLMLLLRYDDGGGGYT